MITETEERRYPTLNEYYKIEYSKGVESQIFQLEPFYVIALRDRPEIYSFSYAPSAYIICKEVIE